MATPLPSPKGSGTPQKSAYVYYGQMAGWKKLVLGMEVGFSSGYFVLDGDPGPLPEKGAQPLPQFSAHFYCGQMAGCIKMPLSMEVGLSSWDFVLDGDTAPLLKKRAEPPNFWPMFIVAKRLDGSRWHLA